MTQLIFWPILATVGVFPWAFFLFFFPWGGGGAVGGKSLHERIKSSNLNSCVLQIASTINSSTKAKVLQWQCKEKCGGYPKHILCCVEMWIIMRKYIMCWVHKVSKGLLFLFLCDPKISFLHVLKWIFSLLCSAVRNLISLHWWDSIKGFLFSFVNITLIPL